MNESFSEAEFEAWFANAREEETRVREEESQRQAAEARRSGLYTELLDKLRLENVLPYVLMDNTDMNFAILAKQDAILAQSQASSTEWISDDDAYDKADAFVRNRILDEQLILAIMADGYDDIQQLENTSLNEAVVRKGMLLAELYKLRNRGIFDPVLQFIQEDIIPMIPIDLSEDNFQVYIDEVEDRIEQNATIDNTTLTNGLILSDFLEYCSAAACDKDLRDAVCTDIAVMASEMPNKFERSSRIDELLREQGIILSKEASKAFKERVEQVYPPEG